jgi:hypothetical protein
MDRSYEYLAAITLENHICGVMLSRILQCLRLLYECSFVHNMHLWYISLLCLDVLWK